MSGIDGGFRVYAISSQSCLIQVFEVHILTLLSVRRKGLLQGINGGKKRFAEVIRG